MGPVLAAARDQGITKDERRTRAFRDAVIRAAWDGLGAIGDARPWKSNFNADLVLLDIPGRSPLVLKIMVSKPAEVLAAEFKALLRLHEVATKTSAFAVPVPVLDLTERSAYVASLADGRPLTELLRAGRAPARDAIVGAACGRALWSIHADGDVVMEPFDARAVVDDLVTNGPWGLGSSERAVLERVVAHLHGVPVPVSALYLDFDPVNVLVDGATPVLLDPPERVVRGPVQWDLGVFSLGLRRAWWRHPARAQRSARAASALGAAADEGYRNAAAASLSSTVTDVMELVRLAQLALWWSDVTTFRDRATGSIRALVAVPLVRAERARILKRLEQRCP